MESVEINGQVIDVEVYDTEGEQDIAQSRVFIFPRTTTFLLVYPVTQVSTFETLKSFWFDQHLKDDYRNIPVLVCGNKLDLLRDWPSDYMSLLEIKKVLKNEVKSRNMIFRECSAQDEAFKSGENEGRISNIFKEATKVSYNYVYGQPQNMNKKDCILF